MAVNVSATQRTTLIISSLMASCYDMQLATPRVPVIAVSTAMRILRICFQSDFIFCLGFRV